MSLRENGEDQKFTRTDRLVKCLRVVNGGLPKKILDISHILANHCVESAQIPRVRPPSTVMLTPQT